MIWSQLVYKTCSCSTKSNKSSWPQQSLHTFFFVFGDVSKPKGYKNIQKITHNSILSIHNIPNSPKNLKLCIPFPFPSWIRRFWSSGITSTITGRTFGSPKNARCWAMQKLRSCRVSLRIFQHTPKGTYPGRPPTNGLCFGIPFIWGKKGFLGYAKQGYVGVFLEVSYFFLSGTTESYIHAHKDINICIYIYWYSDVWNTQNNRNIIMNYLFYMGSTKIINHKLLQLQREDGFPERNSDFKKKCLFF